MRTRTKTILVVAAGFAAMLFAYTINGNLAVTGSVSSGTGSGKTGVLNLTGKTSGKASSITVDDSNTATTAKMPNDSTAGLYLATVTSATPASGCAQFTGTGTQTSSTGTACGSGGGGGAAVDFTTFTGIPSCTTSPFVDVLTDSGYSAFCDGSSNLKYRYGVVNAVPIPSNPWSGFNAPTLTQVAGGYLLTGTAGGGNNIQGELMAVPSTPYTQIACFEAQISETFAQAGMIWTNGTNTSTSGIIYFAMLVGGNASPINTAFSEIQLAHQTGVTGSASQYSGTTEWQAAPNSICFGMQDDGSSTLKYAYSFDRQNWLVIKSTTRTDIFTPTNVGVYVNTSSSNTVPQMHLWSWESHSGTLF